MKRLFEKAIKELGTTDYIDCWMLPNGEFLAWPNGQDHRYCGQWCKNGYDGWREFIKEGAVSIHFDEQDGTFIAIRTCGLNADQRMVFERLYEDRTLIRIRECYFEEYEFSTLEKYDHEATTMKDPELIRLRLTDTIGYQIRMSELQDQMEEFDEDN